MTVITSERELKFCMPKHLGKMCLVTKIQPFQLRNDKDIGCRIDEHTVGMTCTPLYIAAMCYNLIVVKG